MLFQAILRAAQAQVLISRLELTNQSNDVLQAVVSGPAPTAPSYPTGIDHISKYPLDNTNTLASPQGHRAGPVPVAVPVALAVPAALPLPVNPPSTPRSPSVAYGPVPQHLLALSVADLIVKLELPPEVMILIHCIIN